MCSYKKDENSVIKIEGVENKKVGFGTKDFSIEPAMSENDCYRCIEVGMDYSRKLKYKGYELVGIGEMGIGEMEIIKISSFLGG